MPKVQISKEEILEKALRFVVREGHEHLNIKSIAEELGKSTQTVSWTFGTMENFRNELVAYALEYFNSRLIPNGDNPVKSFAEVGKTYLELAYDEPNLLRFIHANSSKIVNRGGLGAVFDNEKNSILKNAIMKCTGMDEAKTLMFMTGAITYTQGLVSFLLDGTVTYDKETASGMLVETGIIYMIYGGVSEEKARGLME